MPSRRQRLIFSPSLAITLQDCISSLFEIDPESTLEVCAFAKPEPAQAADTKTRNRIRIDHPTQRATATGFHKLDRPGPQFSSRPRDRK